MNRSKRAFGAAAFAVAAATASVIACSDIGDPQAIVDSVVIATGLSTIQVGQSAQLSAVAKNAAGVEISGIEIEWESSNESVATVSDDGLLTGVAPGTSQISAEVDDKTGQFTLTVVPASATATALSITNQPSSSASSGAAFPTQPSIQLRNASGGAVSAAGVVITAAIASGGGTLAGNSTISTNASGVAAFTNLSISGTPGVRTLSFSASGFPTITSSTIDITASVATALGITTQPSSSAQSGVAFAQQPVVQLRDGSGAAVNQAGVNVTAAIASGGGSLGGTATVATNASGIATFTNLSITGTAGARTLSFTSGSLTAATSGTVTITATVPPGATEPVFDAATNTVLMQDNMNSYTTVAAMAALPAGSAPRIVPHPSPITNSEPIKSGSQLIDNGRTGKALRLAYSGANQEEQQFITLNTPGTADNTTHYISYYVRINASAPFTGAVPIKWLELWRVHANGRLQFNTHDPLPCPGGSFSKTYWQVIDTKETVCDARQPVGPWFNDLVNDGQWHRFTYQVRSNSAPGARDGIARMWIDGQKIIDISATAVGVTPPGGDKTWCEFDDLDALANAESIREIWWGSTQTLPTPAWSFDIDDFIWWR